MNKIKIKPKPLRTNINNKFKLSPSAQGEISRSVLYDIKLKKLIRYLTDFREKSGIDYERLCLLLKAIESILTKNGEIKNVSQK